MADRYLVKWSKGGGDWPTRAYASHKEALTFVKELFEEHGVDGIHVETYLNEQPYLGYRRLCQWHKGYVVLD
jgi:hypothetical protein